MTRFLSFFDLLASIDSRFFAFLAGIDDLVSAALSRSICLSILASTATTSASVPSVPWYGDSQLRKRLELSTLPLVSGDFGLHSLIFRPKSLSNCRILGCFLLPSVSG